MNQYDIGILTFWNVPNYGTFVQAYALEQALSAAFPKRDIRQIAYLNKKHYESYYKKKLPKNFLNKRFYKEIKMLIDPKSSYNLRKQKFPEYYKSIKHTEDMDNQQLLDAKFNTVILGSDIIWDYSFECFDNDPLLFGIGLNARDIIAYACSFGTIKRDAELPSYVKQGILAMKKVSVRDENSADIVEGITSVRPPVVLDPTWLWDFNSDPNVKRPTYEDYVIVYGQDFTELYIEQLISYAGQHKLKLICLDCNNDNYEWCDVIIKQAELSPFEWVGLFKYAQKIATSTYHGLTFGLIFKKPIAFCATDFILSKASSLLKEIGLYELLSPKGQSVDRMLNYEWNYERIVPIINKKRKQSFDYLKQIINCNV